jgi:hypothetical protein
MKLIEAKQAKEFASTFLADKILQAAVNAVLDNAPGFELVRCKDCKHYMTIHCTCDGCCISDDWYCADGERRTDG